MGIYDTVKFVAFCPACGARISDFQTKDEFASLSNRHVEEAEEWHTDCPDCNLSIEFERGPRDRDDEVNFLRNAKIIVNYVDHWSTVKGRMLRGEV